MQLTTEIVSRYVGGQLEIRNSVENYLYRGEIEKAWVEDGEMRVRFHWLAKMGEDAKWYLEEKSDDYSINLGITTAQEIGEDRLHYSVSYVWESGTFFPIDGSRLDVSNVIGFLDA